MPGPQSITNVIINRILSPVGILIKDITGRFTAVVDSTGALKVTWPVSATAGMATAAKQDAQTALLTTIDADTSKIPTDPAKESGKLTTIDSTMSTLNAKFVTGTDIGDVTINNGIGAAAVPIQDGGNSITVDGTFWQTTQPVSGTFWQATQPVSATDLDIRNLASTQDNVAVTTMKPDGTNTAPSMDVNSRAGFVKLTNGTLEIGIKAASGATAAADIIQEVQWVDPAGRTAKVDPTGPSLKTIENEHEAIHRNISYLHTITLTSGIGVAAVNDLLFVTPNTAAWAHFIYEILTDADHTMNFYEDATTSADGSARTEVNKYRNSPATAACVVTNAPTVTGVGTQIDAYRGGARLGASTIRGRDEFVLKQNAKYLFRVTTNTAATYLCIRFHWYEHTNA